MRLAQLNVGRLVADTDHSRVAEFMGNLDRINGLAERMPGFVWRVTSEGGTGIKIGGVPRFIPNLSVWASVEALEAFAWNTVHRQFYERRAVWFEVLGSMHFVRWVPEGHRPPLEEAMERLARRDAECDSDHAFGWRWLQEARLWRTRACVQVAA